MTRAFVSSHFYEDRYKGRPGAGRRGEYNPRDGGAADALDDAITKLEAHMIAEDA